jgi:hypothetical protein
MMNAFEAYKILGRLRDRTQDVIDASQDKEVTGVALDERIALEMAIQQMAHHVPAIDLCSIDDLTDVHSLRARHKKAVAMTVDYSG